MNKKKLGSQLNIICVRRYIIKEAGKRMNVVQVNESKIV